MPFALAGAGVDIDALSHPARARRRLQDAARTAKIALTRDTEHAVDLPRRLFGISSIWYTREQHNTVFAAQMDRAEMYVTAALKAARLTEVSSGTTYDVMRTPIDELTGSVTNVVLSGGLSQIPYVAQRLKEFFPPTTSGRLWAAGSWMDSRSHSANRSSHSRYIATAGYG